MNFKILTRIYKTETSKEKLKTHKGKTCRDKTGEKKNHQIQNREETGKRREKSVDSSQNGQKRDKPGKHKPGTKRANHRLLFFMLYALLSPLYRVEVWCTEGIFLMF